MIAPLLALALAVVPVPDCTQHPAVPPHWAEVVDLDAPALGKPPLTLCYEVPLTGYVPGERWRQFLAESPPVTHCESTDRAGARNGNHYGKYQIAVNVHRSRIERLGWTVEDTLESVPNTAIAFSIWAEQGWRPWACKP